MQIFSEIEVVNQQEKNSQKCVDILRLQSHTFTMKETPHNLVQPYWTQTQECVGLFSLALIDISHQHLKLLNISVKTVCFNRIAAQWIFQQPQTKSLFFLCLQASNSVIISVSEISYICVVYQQQFVMYGQIQTVLALIKVYVLIMYFILM